MESSSHPSARTIARLMTTGRYAMSKAESVTTATIESGVTALVEARSVKHYSLRTGPHAHELLLAARLPPCDIRLTDLVSLAVTAPIGLAATCFARV